MRTNDNKFNLVILFVVFITAGCRDSKKTNPDFQELKKSDDTVSLINHNNYILGFTLNQDEYDRLDSVSKGEYDENYSDFMYNLEQYSSEIDTSDIKIKISGSRYFKLSKKLIDKKSLNSDLGLIFINKKGDCYISNNWLLNDEIEKVSDSIFYNKYPPVTP